MPTLRMQEIAALLQIAVLIFSVVIHEVSHGFMAEYLGDPTARLAGRLTLNPFKHLEWFGSVLVPIITSALGIPFGWAKPVPYNPYNLRGGVWGPALVAAAGPGSNLLLAVVMSILVHVLGGALPALFVEFLRGVIYVNIALAIFNLIPVPPLDGSKLLFSALSPRHQNIIDALERYQLFLVLGVVLVGVELIQPIIRILYQLLA